MRLFSARAAWNLVRRQDGAAAVEFGLVAIPFFALLFAILEIAIVFFAGQVLETIVADAARGVMTGQAQTAFQSVEAFRSGNMDAANKMIEGQGSLCERVKRVGLFSCGGLTVAVHSYNTFSDASGGSGSATDMAGKIPGGPGCVVVVKVSYPWPIYINQFNNLANHKLVATAAFRTEPYATGGGSC
jgi:Flp pilus assembly protein TadG